jgi:hypothetical protein
MLRLLDMEQWFSLTIAARAVYIGSCIERNSEARIFAIWGWQVPVPSKSLGYEGSSRGTQGRFNSAALDSVLREH